MQAVDCASQRGDAHCPGFDEEWKDVVGYEGVYEVSSLGNVRRVGKNKLMKQHLRKGYAKLLLSMNNIKKDAFVHRLVAEAFLERTEDRKFVNHINGIKNDNRIENLEWVTSSENEIHSIQVLGKSPKNIQGNKFLSVLTSEQVMEARAVSELFSRRIIALKLGVSETTINSAVNYQTHKNIGSIPLNAIAPEVLDEYRKVAANAKSQSTTYRLPNPENLDGEIWKPCLGFEGLYEVSNKGRVKGLKRNSILAPAISPNGRQRVVLCKDNKTKQHYVDNLVRATFAENLA